MKYSEAANAIRKLITDQKLRPGSQLPSARNLAIELGCYRKTSDRACQDLISKGILTRNGYKLLVSNETQQHSSIDGTIYVLSYWDGFIRQAGRILSERGVKHRLIELSHTRHRNPLPTLRKIFTEKPAGIILWIPYWNIGMESLGLEKIPMVICSDSIQSKLHLHISGTDYYRGIEKAIHYLWDLGHRHIAHVTSIKKYATNIEITECYRKVCLQMGLKQSALTLWELQESSEEGYRNLMQERHLQHPEVTAIFADYSIATKIVKIFRVPEELSVIGMGNDLKSLGLTTVSIREEDDSNALWACTNLISQIQSLNLGLPPKLPRRTLFVPDLVIRESTRALSAKVSRIKLPDRKVEQGRLNPCETWQKTYPFLKKNSFHKWSQLDLTKSANHSMTKEHGWLGADPLLHFEPGLRSLHGIPFQVIDERRNEGRAVITFRSPRTHTANQKTLPIKAKFPLNCTVKALYFLHGCGFATPVPFAEYIMHFKNGKTETVQLIPIGISPDLARKRLGKLKPNIQDWWMEFEQQDFPHSMHAIVFNPADPTEYERYLYTLEWINPRPKDEVDFLEIHVDPKAGPTLALIAVTALL